MLKLFRQIAFLIGLFLVLSHAAAVPAQGGASSSDRCHQPVDGGCAASPGGNFTQANFSAHARQSGQKWKSDHPWNWNSCGIDYACGYYTPTSGLLDPSIAALPNGCAYLATGGSGRTPIIYCSAENNLTIQGYDFSLHGCLPLIVSAGQTGTLTIRDDNFKMGPNCAANNSGPGVGPVLIRAYDPSTANLDLESNNIDGDMYNQSQSSLCLHLATYGGAMIKYNAIFRCDGRPITFPGTTSGNVVSKYNYVEDYSLLGGIHGEFIMASFASGSVALEQSSYDTVLQGSGAQINGSTALISLTPGTPCCVIGSAQIDHLVGISNKHAGSNTISEIGWFGGGYGQITIEDSYGDATGAFGFWGNGGGTCSNATTFARNVNLLNGESENTWSTNTGQGC